MQIDETQPNQQKRLTQLRDAMRAANLVPISDSPTAYRPDSPLETACCWDWKTVGKILDETLTTVGAEFTERRVYSLVNPNSASPMDEATTGLISAGIQLLRAGEVARPHRHSMNALRFVMEGSGAQTLVDGKPCPMHPGDLVFTPGWCWHEHFANGTENTVWLDILDFAFHLAFRTNEFQPGPAPETTETLADNAYFAPGLLPVVEGEEVEKRKFRFPYMETIEALERTPERRDGVREVRYTNPMNGATVLDTLDCTMAALPAGHQTCAFRTTASMVCVVADGHGTSEINGKTIDWRRNDVFTVPARSWAKHRALTADTRLFQTSNRPIYSRLGLLSETFAQ